MLKTEPHKRIVKPEPTPKAESTFLRWNRLIRVACRTVKDVGGALAALGKGVKELALAAVVIVFLVTMLRTGHITISVDTPWFTIK